MFKLSKKGFNKENIISYGNMFLIGNGHLGYRGTLEEYSKNEMVGLNVVGFYDRYQKKWRESINLPNPFFALLYSKDKVFSVLNETPTHHEVSLDIKKAIFKRVTEYEELSIIAERFIPQSVDNLLCHKYQIKFKKDIKLSLSYGLDIDMYEINGPHFVSKKVEYNQSNLCFEGITNEHKKAYMNVKYMFDKKSQINGLADGIFNISINAKNGEVYTFYAYASIGENKLGEKLSYKVYDYAKIKKSHQEIMSNRWSNSDVIIKGNKKAQFAIRYSIYHLLILGNKNYETSIPARGLSGQTYKGAIFWDTEIFLLPFYALTDSDVAKSLLKYRIKTLKGAKKKAKECGFDGAFYAWESQEKGQEGCSKYNVSDPVTGKPVRTYFGEKQIHISADIAYGFIQYMLTSGDESILYEGGLEVLIEIIKFYLSYAVNIDGKYHLNDVIGPDEYHERVDDNAFTNYLVHFVVSKCVEYIYKCNIQTDLINVFEKFRDNLYLPPINEKLLIEQFKNYYLKEDVLVEEVKKRIRHPNEYWGTKNGVAHPTRVIKQADVITLLVLLGNQFNLDVKKANFDFYYPYTEHGSSLSASMYSIIASQIGHEKICYDMFLKSATIDLGTNQKMYAGGIYIGGTHPASNGGSYLSLLFGMAGLSFDNEIKLNPNLPKQIKGLEFKIIYHQKQYNIKVFKDNTYEVEEIQ